MGWLAGLVYFRLLAASQVLTAVASRSMAVCFTACGAGVLSVGRAPVFTAAMAVFSGTEFIAAARTRCVGFMLGSLI